ncbi:Nucleoporin [Penicillium angulare]|uniref:Nucleoporin n=1 Tax=Penicillium angulare TaxID=116970 RepID=UPI00253FADC9|nr:Nucleoporin [Penicillium angulare]KAJ5281346.1 Nucleoporin [Penicillium angulare]
MFVPKANPRNPRRRPRTSSDESVKPPKAKRQRSVLRQAEGPPSVSLDYENGQETVDLATSLTPNEQAGEDAHLPIRAVKPTEEPSGDLDGAIVLSSTDYYTADQLPALPDQIRGLATGKTYICRTIELVYQTNLLRHNAEPLKSFFSASQDYALALTHSHAIVWPYNAPNSAPPPSQTFTVSIPESCRDPHGPVPLGILLSTATGEYPGLLVIIPSTGKIIYWETVSSAATLGLSRQKQNGIQGFTPGLLSGEYATEIMNCEPSGTVAIFSSGRTAHITLRDSQGKPSVLVNFLRSGSSSGAGGFLGGIKSVLGGGYWRKEVSAVRAGESRQRGQRDVIIATSTGLVEIWDTHWNHGNALKKKFDVKEDIIAALPIAAQEPGKPTGEPDLKIMDFAYVSQPSSDDSESHDTDESWRLYLVASSTPWLESRKIFVIELSLSGKGSQVLSTRPVDLSNIPAIQEDSKPRILVPKSEKTAFILIKQSLVILSLTSTVEETPTSQLLSSSNELPLSFQDSIHLRTGKEYEVLGYGVEDVSDGEDCDSCVLMIRNFGVVRVNVAPHYPAEIEVDEGQLSAKHKLEQAIFFGTMAKNPLDLIGEGGLDFAAAEIEQASLEICSDLLRSESRFIPNTSISIEENLRLRAKALDDLALLLGKKGYPLSRPAKWELLWGAEKLAAQRAMCTLDQKFQSGEDGHFISHVIESMNDKFKTRSTNQQDPADHQRTWFLRDSYQMEHIIPWIKNAIKPRRGNSSKQARKLSEQILQASELLLAIMETAYQFRDRHAASYGLGDDFLEDGVVADGYEDLPEFWTSRAVGYAETGHLLDWELDSCRAWIQQSSSADAPDGQTLKKIAINSARHLRVLGQMHQERTRWLASQNDPKLVDEGVSIEQSHMKERKWQLFKLAGIGHLQDALSLAERFRDMGALVELIIELQDQVKNGSSQNTSGDSATVETEADVAHRISQYFEKFGDSWADAYFSRQISMGHPGALLSMRKYQSSVTRFLRTNPAYSKLSWINDVNGEDDYETAAVCLENLAIDSEKQLWCHRVQVSLAKLGLLASSENQPALGNGSALQDNVKRLDSYSEVDAVQELLQVYVQPVLEGAIDQKAETELVLDYFGSQLRGDRPSLHEILGETFSALIGGKIVGVDGLIDLLTLMGSVPVSDEIDNELREREFYHALRVLDHSQYAQQDQSYLSALRKLIWRRCMIKDDWKARGKAAEKSNGDVDSAADSTALYTTLTTCLTEHAETVSPSIYKPLSPTESLMAESESDILVSRFRPEQRARVAVDLKREDDLLRDYIEAGKLDFWFQNLLSTIESQTSAKNTAQPDNQGSIDMSLDSKVRLTWV